MPRYCLDLRSEPDWAPLEQLARLCGERTGLPELDPHDFMYMGTLTADDGRVVQLYKHVNTRRYLNLDTAGHTYSVTASAGSHVAARVLPDLRSAVLKVLRLSNHAEVHSAASARSRR